MPNILEPIFRFLTKTIVKNRKIDSYGRISLLLDQLRRQNGGGQTRTDEVVRRGIYSPLQLPLCDTPIRMGKNCWRKELNPQPTVYKTAALPLSYASIVNTSKLPLVFEIAIGICYHA